MRIPSYRTSSAMKTRGSDSTWMCCRQTTPRPARTLRFDANSVVDRPGDALFATQVSLGCLDGNVSEEELNLLQLSPSRVTQLRARATEVVRGNLVQTEHFRVVLDNVPDHSFRYVITPTLTRPADTTKQSPA